MIKNPLISVIIPTFNRKLFLEQAVDSVIAQSYRNLEIIIVDDGSTDGTGEFIKTHYPKIRYIFQERRGVSAARNTGIFAAAGTYIAFLDSDDLWKKNKLALQMAALQANPGYKICYTDEVWIRNGEHLNQKKIHQKYGGWIFERCLGLCIISPSSIILERTVIEDIGLFDEKLKVCEDYDYWLRLCLKYPILFCKEKLIIKRGGHRDQLSRKYWGMDRFRVKALENIIKSPDIALGQIQAGRQELAKKCKILAIGYKNRGKIIKSTYYAKKEALWTD